MKIRTILPASFIAVSFEKDALWDTRVARATRASPWVCSKPNHNFNGVAPDGAGTDVMCNPVGVVVH
jgi:hypothetical protein